MTVEARYFFNQRKIHILNFGQNEKCKISISKIDIFFNLDSQTDNFTWIPRDFFYGYAKIISMVTQSERNMVAALQVGMISIIDFLEFFRGEYGDDYHVRIDFVLTELGLRSKNLIDS